MTIKFGNFANFIVRTLDRAMPNMTGRPGHRTMEMNGGSSVPYVARTPCVPLFSTLFFIGVETEGLLDYQGRAGDHYHCTVEPSPGHIRCRGLRAKIHATVCKLGAL